MMTVLMKKLHEQHKTKEYKQKVFVPSLILLSDIVKNVYEVYEEERGKM